MVVADSSNPEIRDMWGGKSGKSGSEKEMGSAEETLQAGA